ncbi:MAG: hypothetical protein IPH13_22650 [Planctomycetes bacterium]|nr:hypothetical protein [Planctomycetota bacterium]
MRTALPSGLLDAPYDIGRLLDYWLSLPAIAREPWWTPVDAVRFATEADQILTQFRNGRRPSQVVGDFPDWDIPLDGLKVIESDALPSIGQALVALVNGRVGEAFGAESPLDEPWRRFGHEILEIAYWTAPDRFAPSIFGFEFLAYVLRGEAALTWSEIEGASQRILLQAKRRGLDRSSVHLFSRWLSSWGELTVRRSDDTAIRAAKDLLWQVLGPSQLAEEIVAKGDRADLVVRTSALGSIVANELRRSRDDALHDLAAPCVSIELESPINDARYILVAAPVWSRGSRTLFPDGNSYALMCGPAFPTEVPELVQTGLRRLFTGAERVVLSHRPAWQKGDGWNDERAEAWATAIDAFGPPTDGSSVTWGEFDVERRTFVTERAEVRRRLLLETVVRAALERREYLEVLRSLSVKACEPIESFLRMAARDRRNG